MLSSDQHVWLLSHPRITQKLEAIFPIVQKFQPYRNNQKALIHPHLSKIRSTSLRKYSNHRPRRQNVDYFGCKRNNTDLTQAFINTPCAFFYYNTTAHVLLQHRSATYTTLLSLADRSLDGQYGQCFLGRGKDGGTGFKVPNQEERDWYLHTVEQFSNKFLTVESLSESDTRWALIKCIIISN